MAPRLHALLEAYGRRTGIPVLLNTSFNLAGEPIVNHAVEGYSTSGAAGSTCWSPARPWSSKRAARGGEAGEGGRVMVIKKRSGMRRRLIMLGSVGGSIADLARGHVAQRVAASAGWCRWPCSSA